MRRVLDPHASRKSRSHWHISFGDGQAEVDLSDDGIIASQVTGRDPWDLLVRGAQAANWVIIPMDCPTCLTQPGSARSFPRTWRTKSSPLTRAQSS